MFSQYTAVAVTMGGGTATTEVGFLWGTGVEAKWDDTVAVRPELVRFSVEVAPVGVAGEVDTVHRSAVVAVPIRTTAPFPPLGLGWDKGVYPDARGDPTGSL